MTESMKTMATGSSFRKIQRLTGRLFRHLIEGGRRK